eukprot:c17171_g1_i1 orf=414-1730(-)
MQNQTLSPNSRGSLSFQRQGGIFSSSTLSVTSSSSLQLTPQVVTVEERRRKVIAITILSSNAANEDFYHDKLLSGDIVDRITGSNGVSFTSPFAGGKSSVFVELDNFHKSGINTLTIQVRRGEREIARTALIVPNKKNKNYVLQDYHNPSHVFTFDEYTQEKCWRTQAQMQEEILVHLPGIRVGATSVSYPWKEKMGQVQNVEEFRMVYSMLVVPYAYGGGNMSQPSNLEDTVNQAITWLYTSKNSGVPLTFRNIQTEPLLTEASGQSSNNDLLSIVNTGTYDFKQFHGSNDLGVVRAVRIWFEFKFAEVKVELLARPGEALLGVGIGRTIEGFCYVASVDANTAADRAGLKKRIDAAHALKMKLVVTRVFDEKVIPWFISNGNIRCYDIRSISSKLLAHHRAGQPACLHLLDVDVATPQAPVLMSTSSSLESSICMN